MTKSLNVYRYIYQCKKCMSNPVFIKEIRNESSNFLPDLGSSSANCDSADSRSGKTIGINR